MNEVTEEAPINLKTGCIFLSKYIGPGLSSSHLLIHTSGKISYEEDRQR